MFPKLTGAQLKELFGHQLQQHPIATPIDDLEA
jgi:hypothetical protein